MSQLHKKRIAVGVLILVSFIVIMAIILNYIQYQKDHITDNVFDEIYWAVSNQQRQMLEKVENTIFPSKEWRESSVWGGYNYTVGGYENPTSSIATSIVFLKEPRVIVFLLPYHKQIVVDNIGNGSVLDEWSACVYWVDSNELSYCASDADTAELSIGLVRDQMEDVLANWCSANQDDSLFNIDDLGEFSDLGYRYIEDETVQQIIQQQVNHSNTKDMDIAGQYLKHLAE